MFLADSTVDSWLLMGSPWKIFTIIGVWMVFVMKIGPALMEKRKPMEMRRVLVGYNAFQVLFSAFICYTVGIWVYFRTPYNNHYFPFHAIKESNIYRQVMTSECSGHRDRESELRLFSGAWFYFFSKVIDLLDTIFFVLRKKQKQITFLHLYHHTVTAIFSWAYLKYIPGK